MITPADIKARFPEFAEIDNARIAVFISDAMLYIDVVKFGSFYNLALSYLTAHYLALSERTASGDSGGAGTASSESVGDTSVSYTTPNLDRDFYYKTTSYGIRFLEIRSMVIVGLAII